MPSGLIIFLFLLPMAPADGRAPAPRRDAQVLPLRAQSEPTSPAEELRRGKNAFDRGEYGRAIQILRPLLYPDIRLESEAQIVQAHRMLGVAHLFEGAQPAAAQEFRKLLQVRPDYRFDPLLDPPQVVDFFDGVLRQHGDELAVLEARRREAERARQRDREECEKALGGPAVIERKVGRNSFALNFLPFGAGQFQNGHRKKGWAFLVGESALGAVSVSAFATNLALHGLRPQRGCKYDTGGNSCPPEHWDHSAEDRSRWLLRTQVASGALFFAVAIWGVIDALHYYQPESLLGETPLPASASPLPAPAAPLPASASPPPAPASPPPAPASTSTLRLEPWIARDALGTGLSFRF